MTSLLAQIIQVFNQPLHRWGPSSNHVRLLSTIYPDSSASINSTISKQLCCREWSILKMVSFVN